MLTLTDLGVARSRLITLIEPNTIPLRAIAAGCRPGGTVLDPFAGAATTALAARQLGRQFIGIELNADYCALAKARLLAAGAERGGEAE